MTSALLLVGCRAAGGALPGLHEPFSLAVQAGVVRAVGGPVDPAGFDVIDITGAFLTPGIVDVHVHLGLDGGGTGAGPDRAGVPGADGGAALEAGSTLLRNARLHRAAGVATVRDLGPGAGPTSDDSPRIVWSGGALTRRGRYGGFLGTTLAPGDDPAAAVRARALAGAGVIKVILTGSVDFDRNTAEPPHFTPKELRRMTDAAHAEGLPVAVHANGAEAVKVAAEAGADSVEHGILADEAAVWAMAAAGCVWVPTLTPLWALAATGRWPGLPGLLAAHGDMVARGHDLGVRVAAGTDAGSPGVPHGSLLTEVALLRRAGLGPAAARAAATVVGADLLHLPGEYGRLVVGARADLVWFARDPFAGTDPAAVAGSRPAGMLAGSASSPPAC